MRGGQLRNRVLGVFAAASCACGLDLAGRGVIGNDDASAGDVGGEAQVADAAAPDGEADGGGGADAPLDVSADAPLDAVDTGPPPADAGPILYVVSARLWTFDPSQRLWSGGQPLPTATCPDLDELAVDRTGALYATGSRRKALLRVDQVTPPTCTPLGTTTGVYPRAMSFAPLGTLAPIAEVLVGYLDNGDYVRIDTTDGAMTVVTPGAFAGFDVHDLVSVGSAGYAVMTGGSCGPEDCLWKIDFTTGRSLGVRSNGNYPTDATRIQALAQWAGRLYAFGPDTVYESDVDRPNNATRVAGPPGLTSVGFRGAASTTAAPSQ